VPAGADPGGSAGGLAPRRACGALSAAGARAQAVRDEILNIMHRNHISEKKGSLMEEWHQKLHNNTTPDDVAICAAYIAFLEAGGDVRAYWGVLSEHGAPRLSRAPRLSSLLSLVPPAAHGSRLVGHGARCLLLPPGGRAAGGRPRGVSGASGARRRHGGGPWRGWLWGAWACCGGCAASGASHAAGWRAMSS